jgi:hypothetical protein
MLIKWLPDKFHRSISIALLLILKIKSCEEPGIEAHVCKESWVCIRVTEGIDMPSNAGLDSEFLKEELVTNHHVVDHVFVVSAGLIVHAPACIHEF